MQTWIGSNTRFFIFFILFFLPPPLVIRITPIRSPFCQLTNTYVKQDGIKKMEGGIEEAVNWLQVRYADAIDGWSTSKRLVVSLSMVDETGELRSHRGSRGGWWWWWWGTETRRRMIISRCRHVATGLTGLSVPRFTSTLLIKLRGLQINLSLITRPVPIRTGENPPPARPNVLINIEWNFSWFEASLNTGWHHVCIPFGIGIFS